MSEYYCLVAGLPDVAFDGSKAGYSVEKFREDIMPELSVEDARIVNLSFYRLDNANILLLLRQGAEIELQTLGCFTKEQLLDIISTAKEGDARSKDVPAYMYDFLDYYFENIEQNMFWEDVLCGYYYNYAVSAPNKFVAQWFEFNRNVNNILVAMAARKYKMSVADAVVGDDDIAEALRTSAARDFGLSDSVEYLEELQRINENGKLLERERQLDNMRWRWLEENSVFNYFTIERLFVFIQKISIVERWAALDAETGMQRYTSMVNELKGSAQISKSEKK